MGVPRGVQASGTKMRWGRQNCDRSCWFIAYAQTVICFARGHHKANLVALTPRRACACSCRWPEMSLAHARCKSRQRRSGQDDSVRQRTLIRVNSDADECVVCGFSLLPHESSQFGTRVAKKAVVSANELKRQFVLPLKDLSGPPWPPASRARGVLDG